MKSLLLSLVLIISLNATEVVWDGSRSISKKEYDKAIKEYIDKTYPKKVKAYTTAIQKKKRAIENKTTKIDTQMWQDDRQLHKMNWIEAKEYCQDLDLVGFHDWYLPSYSELKRLYNDKEILKRDPNDAYWSSTTAKNDHKNAWHIYFSNGSSYAWDIKINEFYVRCVRRLR